jgi:DNA-binding protein YbaB
LKLSHKAQNVKQKMQKIEEMLMDTEIHAKLKEKMVYV